MPNGSLAGLIFAGERRLILPPNDHGDSRLKIIML